MKCYQCDRDTVRNFGFRRFSTDFLFRSFWLQLRVFFEVLVLPIDRIVVGTEALTMDLYVLDNFGKGRVRRSCEVGIKNDDDDDGTSSSS